jgi:hypothetical protein
LFVSQLPVFHTEIAAARDMVGAFVALSSGAQEIITIAEGDITPLLDRAFDPKATLSDASRKKLQQALLAAIPRLELGAQGFVDANILLRRIPQDAWVLSIPRMRVAYDSAVAASSFFANIESLVALSPHLAGFDGAPRTYLLLFQNDTELRPTGGFIGSYGILRVKDGRMVDFKIDDTYNLDNRAPKQGRPTSPEPLKDYLGQPTWYFRDVNWSPDFPETAMRALQFYRDEGGVGAPNAVIAVTTKTLVDILKITAPIRVGARQFSAENVIDTLQLATEVDYHKQGIPTAERKAIIGVLGQALAERMGTLSLYELRDVLHVLKNNLDQKNILIYDTHPEAQQKYLARNWGGEIKQVETDYLMVVDANLGSLKTDPAVSRTIRYAVNQNDDGQYIADLTVTYDHAGQFNWKTTRLRNYVRIYVPEGSALRTATGFMVREKMNQPGSVAVSRDHGKTVFAGFVSVEPGETKTLRLQYVLPSDIVTSTTSSNLYELYVQKQPGAAPHELMVTGPAIKPTDWSPRSLGASLTKTGQMSWDTKLATDQQFSLTWKRE